MQDPKKPRLSLRDALAQNVGIPPVTSTSSNLNAKNLTPVPIENQFIGNIPTSSNFNFNNPCETNQIRNNLYVPNSIINNPYGLNALNATSSIPSNFNNFKFPSIPTSSTNIFSSTSSALINNNQECVATTSTNLIKQETMEEKVNKS